jgi:hypothetical protein
VVLAQKKVKKTQQVVLLSDVQGVGKAGQIIKVNYLSFVTPYLSHKPNLPAAFPCSPLPPSG